MKVLEVLGGCEVRTQKQGKGGVQKDLGSLSSEGLGPRQHLLLRKGLRDLQTRRTLDQLGWRCLDPSLRPAPPSAACPLRSPA